METLTTLNDYVDTGAYSRPISTRSADAQARFDHGLAWAYGFNLEESLRCFRRAAEADPDCNRQWEQFDATELPRKLEGPTPRPGGRSPGATFRSALPAFPSDAHLLTRRHALLPRDERAGQRPDPKSLFPTLVGRRALVVD